MNACVVWLHAVRMDDVKIVGGKNTSLGDNDRCALR